MINKKKFSINNLVTYIILIIACATTILPLLWMFLTSFKTFEESIQIPMTIFPESFNPESYKIVLNKFPFDKLFINTFLVMIVVVIGQIVVCSLAAYAFARLSFPGKELIFLLCLSIMMIPGQTFIIPRYELINKWGLADTITALWLPNLFDVFGVFMLRQFFSTLPKELDEAAKIDGSGFFRIYYQILLPLIKPAIVSLAILTALTTWKDLLWPLIINTDINKQTLSAGLALLIGEHTTYYPQVMAGAFISVVPMIVIFFFLQRFFIEGIALSGTKA